MGGSGFEVIREGGRVTPRQRREFYHSPEWRALSRQIRERDGHLCTACKPRTVGARLVHHVTPLSAGGSALDPANLTSLCSECHRLAHGQVVDVPRQEWKRYIKNLMERY